MSGAPEPVDRHHAGGGDSRGSGGAIGRTLEAVLPVYASAIFVVLWVFVVLAALTDSSLPAETWAWLSALDLLPAIVAWIAILPLGVFLWAAQANLEPVWMALVMLGLIGWTSIAGAGLARLPGRRAVGRA
jgi:hypothetical protein